MNWIIDYGEAESLPGDEDLDTDLHVDEMANPRAYNPFGAFGINELDGSDEGEMVKLRRKICCDMWEQYQRYLREMGEMGNVG